MTDNNDETRFIQPDYSLLGDEHVRRYRETGGEVGHIWNGATVLLLTTVGNKTGKQRTVPLIYGQDGADFLVVASKGGAAQHPAWYLNLEQHPQAEIQVLDKTMRVQARTAEPGEKDRLWKIMTDVWPNYDQYTRRTERIIPVVILQSEV